MPLSRGRIDSRRNCKSERPTPRTTQRCRAPTKGLCPSYAESPPGASTAPDGLGGTPRRSHSYPSGTRGRTSDAALWASASRCPSRSSAQKRARATTRRPPSSSRWRFTETGSDRRWNHLQSRAHLILVHPHEVGRPPPSVVASGTGREHRLLPATAADESPGLAPEVLVQRMRMPDLGRDGLSAMGADGSQRRIPLGARGAALSWQDTSTELVARGAGGRVPAAVVSTAPVRSPPRLDRSAAGRGRPSAG
jgi:hypothetical protein